MKNLTEIMTHMFKTMDSFGLKDEGYRRVDELSFYTDNHYSGPGFVYSLGVREDESDYADYDVIFDENWNYLGTMAWIRYLDKGWFNDADPNWLDRV